MWFRQNQSMDTDRIRESLKNQMRRFRSSDASTPAAQPVTPPPTTTPAAAAVATGDVVDFRRIASEIHCDASDTGGAAADCDPCLLAVMRSPSGRQLAKQLDAAAKDGKSASPLAADATKFKSKQRTKSKLVELDKNRCASRKSSVPPDLDNAQIAKTASSAGGGRKHVRSHSNLNFNALLRYKLTNRVQATVDMDSVRRKSVSGESFLAGLVRGRDSTAVAAAAAAKQRLKTQKSLQSCDEQTSSDNEEHDDDLETNNMGSDADVIGVEATALRGSLSVPATGSEHKKSPSLGARVAAHFSSGADSSGGSASSRTKLSKLKKHRHHSRISGLYTQNSFGNYGRGLSGWG